MSTCIRVLKWHHTLPGDNILGLACCLKMPIIMYYTTVILYILLIYLFTYFFNEEKKDKGRVLIQKK